MGRFPSWSEQIDDDDLRELHTLIGQHVLLWESDQGFCNTRIVDGVELARIEAACAADDEGADD